MKKISVMLMVMIMLTVIMVTPSWAANNFGAKAHGMGGAFTAVADDPSAIYWNPAGLTQSGNFGLQTAVGAQFNQDDIDAIKDFLDDYEKINNADSSSQARIDAIQSMEFPKDVNLSINGMIATNLKSIALGSIVNSQFSTTATGEVSDTGTFTRSAENTAVGEAMFSFGKTITNPPFQLGKLALGANLKYLKAKYNKVEFDESIRNTSNKITEIDIDGDGYGVDVGVLAKVTDLVNVGVNVRNVISTLEWEDESYNLKEELERTTTLGVASKLPMPINAIVAADLEIPENGDEVLHLGVQKDILFNGLSLRLGGYQEDDETIYTAGVGFNVPTISINVSADTNEHFNVSGVFKF